MINDPKHIHCLIIAAGMGSRLAQKKVPKPLLSIAGKPLIERTIDNARQAGLKDFIVVTGYEAGQVEDFLNDLSIKKKIQIKTVLNSDWERENGLSVLCARDYLINNFILLMADHIFEAHILKKLCAVDIEKDEVILAVDYRINNNPWIDIDDVTKVQIVEQMIVDIGKNLTTYNCFDTGIFYCRPSLLYGLECSIKDQDFSLSGGIRQLSKRGLVRGFDIKNSFWIDVDDQAAIKKAEKWFESSPDRYF